jgi:hypothetical protein
MSTSDTHDIDDQTTRLPDVETPGTSVSRRTLMKSAAGVGVAAAAIGVVGVAIGTAHSGAIESEVDDGAAATLAGANAVIVHVTDFASGRLEVFNGFTRTQITDRDLAARIARAAKA